MDCKGLHCDGCRHGGGGAAGAVIALIIIIALALHKTWPTVVSGAEIAGYTVAAVTGTAIVVTGAVLTVRALRRRARRRAAACRRAPIVINSMRVYDRPMPPARPAVDPPRDTPVWPLAGWRDGTGSPARGDGNDRRAS
jgi:hypothetical protein